MSKERDYIKNIEGAERRFQHVKVKLETRAQGEEEERTVVKGIAARVDEITDLGFFREKIAPGAFDEALQRADLDIRALFNHDPNLILGRYSATHDSLMVRINKEGHFEYEYETPNRSYALDLADAIQNGDVDQSSFAFRIKSHEWEFDDDDPSNDLRTITKIDEIIDVSPVTYAAYPNTSVAERSRESLRDEKRSEGKSPDFDAFDAQFMYNQNRHKL